MKSFLKETFEFKYNNMKSLLFSFNSFLFLIKKGTDLQLNSKIKMHIFNTNVNGI